MSKATYIFLKQIKISIHPHGNGAVVCNFKHGNDGNDVVDYVLTDN